MKYSQIYNCIDKKLLRRKALIKEAMKSVETAETKAQEIVQAARNETDGCRKRK